VSQKPVVQATVPSANNAPLPTAVSAVLTWNGVAGATLTYSTAGLAPGDPLVIAAQPPSAVTTTGSNTWSLQVVVTGLLSATASGSTDVVAQDASPFGAGWTFAATDQLIAVSGGVLRAYGTGGWSYYASAGGGSYTSPAGDYGTLTQAGGTYTYTTPDGRKWTFNSSGSQTGWASADGQSLLTYSYSGGNLSTATASDGTVTTFNDSGGRVSTLVTGNGRTTTLAYDASGNLTLLTNPDGGRVTLTYDSSHHLTAESLVGLQDGWSYGSGGGLATLTWGSSGGRGNTAFPRPQPRGSAARSAPAWPSRPTRTGT
jgi:YD repeat-containing protein